jgi:hypothetical protein
MSKETPQLEIAKLPESIGNRVPFGSSTKLEGVRFLIVRHKQVLLPDRKFIDDEGTEHPYQSVLSSAGLVNLKDLLQFNNGLPIKGTTYSERWENLMDLIGTVMAIEVTKVTEYTINSGKKIKKVTYAVGTLTEDEKQVTFTNDDKIVPIYKRYGYDVSSFLTPEELAERQ